MRRLLNSALPAVLATLVTLDVPAAGMSSLEEDGPEVRVAQIFEEYRSRVIELSEDMFLAGVEWSTSLDLVLTQVELEEEETAVIQACLKAVESAWPAFDSVESEELVQSWTFRSPEAIDAKEVYLRARENAINKYASARDSLVSDIEAVMADVLSGCFDGHLVLANRIHDRLARLLAQKGGDPMWGEAKDGWELLTGWAADHRGALDVHKWERGKLYKLRFEVREDVRAWGFLVGEDGEEPEKGTRVKGEGHETGFANTRFVFRDSEDRAGEVLGVVIVGAKDAIVRFSPPVLLGGLSELTFVNEDEDDDEGEHKLEQASAEPAEVEWPLEQEGLRALKERVDVECAALKGRWLAFPWDCFNGLASAHEALDLIEKNDVLPASERNDAKDEKARVLAIIELCDFKEECLPALKTTSAWPRTFETRALLFAYQKEIALILDGVETLRDSAIKELRALRCEVMKSFGDDDSGGAPGAGGDASLELANRIDAVVSELERGRGLCFTPKVCPDEDASGSDVPEASPEEPESREEAPKASREARKEYRRRKGAMNRPVKEALDWLVEHQDENGRWDADDFHKHDPSKDRCDGEGQPRHDVGVTGLAVLAFCDSGPGTESRYKKYHEAMRSGLSWLRQQQDYDTGLIGEKVGHVYMYNHAIAALAMCDFYRFFPDPELEEPAQKAIDFILAAQNPYGAWRYESPSNGEQDTSVTGWMVKALKTAERAGLQVDSDSYEGAMTWLEEATEPATGRVGYDGEGSRSSRVTGVNDHYPTDRTECMTAVGLLSRFLLGQDPEEVTDMGKHADLLLKALPEWDPDGLSNDMCYWYYGTQAMWEIGGNRWTKWERSVLSAVKDSQRSDGSFKGSWDPIGPFGFAGGRVYSTSLLVSTMARCYWKSE